MLGKFDQAAGVRSCIMCPGAELLVFDAGPFVFLFDASRKESACMTGHTDTITFCVISADGKVAVSASDDRTLEV
jgi:WD40 repeat protein